MSRQFAICPFCGCGCGMHLEVFDGRLIAALPSQVHPAGAGRLCLRGWQAGTLVQSSRRLLVPQAAGKQASWEDALRAAAEGIRALAAEGPQALGVLGSGYLTNEEASATRLYATQALRTPNLDNFAWALDGGSIWGLEQTLCIPYRSPVLPEIASADVILCLSSSLCADNPQAAGYIMAAAEAGATVIVADEVDQGLRELSTLWVQHKPGARAALLQVLWSALGAPGELSAKQRDTLQQAGVDAGAFAEMCAALRKAKRLALVFSTTTVQTPAEAAHIAEIVMLLNASGQQEAAVFALRAQCNSVGVNDMGLVPGEGRARERGLSLYEMLAEPTPLRALVVIGEGLEKFVGEQGLQALRERLDFLLYLGGYQTATSELADVALPMTTWGETEGTFTCHDGSIWPLHQVVPPTGESRYLPEILRDLSVAQGGPPLPADLPSLRAEISRQVFGYRLVNWEQVAAGQRAVASAVPSEDSAEVQIPADELPVPIEAGPERPYTLLVRRDTGSWACDPRARGAEIVERELAGHRAPFLVINPQTCRNLETREGRSLTISTAFGSQTLPVRCSPGVPPEVVMLPWQFRDVARALAGPLHLDAASRAGYHLPVAAALENPSQS